MARDTFSYPTKMTEEGFDQSVYVWLAKSHVVNKRLWGCKVVHSFTLFSSNFDWNLHSLNLNREKWTIPEETDTFLTLLKSVFGLEMLSTEHETLKTVTVNLVKLFPKLYNITCKYYLLSLHVKKICLTYFFPLKSDKNAINVCPEFPYSFQLDKSTLILRTTGLEIKSTKWLSDQVVPQIIKWGEEPANSGTGTAFCKESLMLVDKEKYYNKYYGLKEKYGKKMVEIWPECTDPSKFVYEDVAIATYLLLLWEQQREDSQSNKMQRFVDLGCGNGLLVYILASEGHPGCGIDVRKRNIWDIYPGNVDLREVTIKPSDVHLFPEVDWLIGNHSDELTPWIPVVAARSSYNCNFFLLPCCCYNFNGSKYQRKDSSKSQYTEYLEYVKDICDVCEIETTFDRLKIPSTKRICLVGRKRKYSIESFDRITNEIQNYIDSDTDRKGPATDDWISDFKPRVQAERVRNCTKVDKSVIDSITNLISAHLLKDCQKSKGWWIGKTEELPDLIKLIPDNLLKCLKLECGGVQTLLKNNHHIFHLVSGKVQLRYPQTVEEVEKRCRKKNGKIIKIQTKVRPCWFHVNHPQGCPLRDEDCSYVHTENKMK